MLNVEGYTPDTHFLSYKNGKSGPTRTGMLVEVSVTFRLWADVLRILKASENRAQPVRPHCSYVCPGESEANCPGPPAFIAILSIGWRRCDNNNSDKFSWRHGLSLIMYGRTLKVGNDNNNMRLNRCVPLKKKLKLPVSTFKLKLEFIDLEKK